MASTPNKRYSIRARNIADLQALARRRLPKVIFDYIEGGAEDEFTLRQNCSAFQEITFRPRQAVVPERCDLRTHLVGHDLSSPVLLAPVGYSRIMHADGEVAAARAAGDAGTAFILSSISGHRLEDVRNASTGPVWYQLYLIGGRPAAEAAIARAAQAGCSALVVTVDTPVAGNRERDGRNGMRELMSKNAFAKLPFLGQFLSRPRWLLDFLLDGGMPKLANIVVPGQGPLPLTDVTTSLANAAVTWEDLRWMRDVWPAAPIIVKGILTADDAKRAVDCGAAAVIVSNHGGRQLDSTSAALHALPEVVEAVGSQADVLVDGGIRRGSDIVKALCLGARAVLVGRAYAYGLAAAGEGGVALSLSILREELERTLKLLGCYSISKLNSSFIEMDVARFRHRASSQLTAR
jgi:isopentenyl diphosphate isomerase/L-lactate dehydrogenase-like FMN-dependent dehydrogenase